VGRTAHLRSVLLNEKRKETVHGKLPYGTFTCVTTFLDRGSGQG
jgi:hypothetical protein